MAERLNRYDTLGYDLIAMTADDLIAAGFVPTNLSNIIDVNHLDYEVVDQLMRGLHDAANFSENCHHGRRNCRARQPHRRLARRPK